MSFFLGPELVLTGLAPDGGLLIPESFPDVRGQLDRWRALNFVGLAQEVVAGDAPAVALNWAREAATMSRGGARSTVSLLRCDDEVLARRLEAEKAAFVRQVRSPEALAGIERFLHRENP